MYRLVHWDFGARACDAKFSSANLLLNVDLRLRKRSTVSVVSRNIRSKKEETNENQIQMDAGSENVNAYLFVRID